MLSLGFDAAHGKFAGRGLGRYHARGRGERLRIGRRRLGSPAPTAATRGRAELTNRQGRFFWSLLYFSVITFAVVKREWFLIGGKARIGSLW